MQLKTRSRETAAARFGAFCLTDAIRRGPASPVIPEEGYRSGIYRRQGLRVPMLAIAVSQERLFDVFLDLMRPFDTEVDVILETSHESDGPGHGDLVRDHIDVPILQSHCCDHEDLLLNDGCTGIAVIGVDQPMEVQFDEHKALIVYADNLSPFEQVLREYEIPSNDGLKLIMEGEHIHYSKPRYRKEFDEFCYQMGVLEPMESYL